MTRRRALVIGVPVLLALLALLAGALVLVLLRRGPATVTVDGRTPAEVSLRAGERLSVDFGRVSPGVGDAWHLVTAPDRAILRDGGQDWQRPPDCEGTGCSLRLTWSFTATGSGRTTLEFRYCYRSPLRSCQSEPSRGPSEPVRITVTVAEAEAA